MTCYALIPARGGSKGVLGKNIKLLNKIPLIAYSIRAALDTQNFSRVIVTTDSEEIAAIAREYGAEVPFMRPAQFATDTATDRDYIVHALDWFKENENNEPSLIALLRPTTPLRDCALLNHAVETIQHSQESTSLRSAHELPEPPQKMLRIENGWLTGFFPDDKRDEYYNLPRQTFDTAYHPNGYIDIVKTSYVRSQTSKIFGPQMIGFVTPFSVEIDRPEDFEYLEFCHSKASQR